jgi:HNH endonuclease
MPLNLKQKEIHERALVVGKNYQIAEVDMIQILQEVEAAQIHKSLGLSSLLKYALKYLKLSEPIALTFIAVARKCKTVPALKTAICEGILSASTANRLVSTITKENAAEIISFAANHTWRETEREIANRNPRAAHPDKVKMLGNGFVQLTITISETDYADFQRSCSIEAQRKNKSPSRGEVIAATIQTHLEKYDPVRKAERVQKRSERTDQNAKMSSEMQNLSVRTDQLKSKTRIPLTAAETHLVDIHHIVPVSKGGTNDPSNLTTLCSFHHDLVHQLSFPIEGQISWLRSPRAAYGIRVPSTRTRILSQNARKAFWW